MIGSSLKKIICVYFALLTIYINSCKTLIQPTINYECYYVENQISELDIKHANELVSLINMEVEQRSIRDSFKIKIIYHKNYFDREGSDTYFIGYNNDNEFLGMQLNVKSTFLNSSKKDDFHLLSLVNELEEKSIKRDCSLEGGVISYLYVLKENKVSYSYVSEGIDGEYIDNSNYNSVHSKTAFEIMKFFR